MATDTEEDMKLVAEDEKDEEFKTNDFMSGGGAASDGDDDSEETFPAAEPKDGGGSTTHSRSSSKESAESDTSTIVREEGAQNAGELKADPAVDVVAETKRFKSPWAQPGAKRGGQRDPRRSKLLSWRGLMGGQRGHYHVGDLVEVEWEGSGWWYLGYVKGEATNADGEQKGGKMYHIVFADGDEADVERKDMRPLQIPGHPRGNGGTLPGHISIADLGTGYLHPNPKAPGQGTKKSNTKHAMGDALSTDREEPSSGRGAGRRGEAEDHETTPGATPSPVLRRGSYGNLNDRRRAGEKALWGGHKPRVNLSAPDLGGAEGDWGNTGTQYSFQPRLNEDKRPIAWYSTGDGGHGNGVTNAVAEEGPVVGRAFGGRGGGGSELGSSIGRRSLRVVQPAEEHEDRGQRVLFAG